MSGRGLGLNFTIGARLSSSIASAFQTLDARMRRTSQAMRGMRDTSRQLTSALDLRARRDDLRQQYIASGRTDARLLQRLRDVSSAYREARTRALRYGNTVEQWRAHQARVNAELNRTEASMRRLNALQAERANRREIVGGLMAAVAPAASVAMPVKLAIDFESGMADAAKTMDGMRDAVGNLTPKYYEMQNVIKGMGRELPLAHDELARLFAAGGQLGMSDVGELKQFATMSAHMAVAFGMSSEEAADSIGTFRTALKMSLTDVGSVLDLMNQYANTSSAKEKDIAETMRRIGSLGDMAGVSAKPMAALAATLTAVGVTPDVAATGIKNMLLAMTKGTSATKGQQAAFAKLGISVTELAKGMQRDGPAAILSVLKAIKQLKAHEQTAVMNELFGSESLMAIAPFLKNMDLAIKNLETAGDTSAYAGAMQQEFANRAKTTANALQLAKNRAAELGINIGSVLLPPLNRLLETVGPMISALADWTAANPALVTGVMGAAGGLVALKLGMLAARLAVSGLRSAMLTATAPLHLMRAAFGGVGIAGRLAGLRAAVAGGMARASRAGWRALAMGVRGVGAAFRSLLGPVGWALTALSLGVEYVIGHWDSIAPYFTGVWERIKAIFKAGLAWIQPVIETIGKGLSLVSDAWNWVSGNDAKAPKAAPSDAQTAVSQNPLAQAMPQTSPLAQAMPQPLAEHMVMPARDAPEPARPGLLKRLWTGLWGGDEGKKETPEASATAAPPEKAAHADENRRVEGTPKAVPPSVPQGPLARALPQASPLAQAMPPSLAGRVEVPTLAERQAASAAKQPRQTDGGAEGRPEGARSGEDTVKAARTPDEQFARLMANAARQAGQREPKAASQAGGQSSPSASQAASQTGGQPAAPQVSVAMQFTLQGMPDATFADNVMRALKGRSGDVEALISSIVHNQARLAYGG